MPQNIQNKTPFEVAAEKILCRIHNEPIIHVNIKEDIKKGDRLICSKCTTQGTILSINLVEHILTKADEDQEKEMQRELKNIGNQQKLILNSIKLCQDLFEDCMKKLNNSICNLTNLNKRYIRVIYQNEVKNLKLKISSSEDINEITLQDIALFLSNHTIKVNDEFILKEQVNLNKKINITSDINISQYEKAIKPLTQSINNLVLLLNRSQELITNPLQQKYKIRQLNIEESDKIGAVAMSNNQQMMASGDHRGKVLLWNLKNQTQIKEFKGEQYIGDMVFSYDDHLLAVEQFIKPNHILIFDLTNLINAEPLYRLIGHNKSIRKITFSQNSQMLLSVSWDQTLKLWNVEKSQLKQSLTLDSALNGLSFSPDEKHIVCGGDAFAYLFDSSNINNIILVTKWKGHKGLVNDTDLVGAYGILFNQDSQSVLTSWKEIKLWSIENLRQVDQEKIPLKVFQGENRMWCLQIRMNNRLISNDGKIKIWDMDEGELITQIEIPCGYQQMSDRKFSFSKDMKYAITGGESQKFNFIELIGHQY